jgi:hypothetical protein
VRLVDVLRYRGLGFGAMLQLPWLDVFVWTWFEGLSRVEGDCEDDADDGSLGFRRTE